MIYGPRSNSWRRLLTACGLLFGMLMSSALNADQLTSGTSSSKARQSVLNAIPFQHLNDQARAKISPVLNKPSIYRRLPVTSIEVDPDYFVFLVRYPEVIVNIWKIMGVTKMVTTRQGPYKVVTDDGAGTISNVELLYGTSNLHIFYGEGTYEGPVLKRKMRGKCVIVLRSDFGQNGPNDTATSQLDVFLKVENATASLVAKTLNPIVGKTADHNFVESLNFIQRLNETTEKNGPGVQHMANRLADINREVRREFVRIAGQVYEKSTGMSVTDQSFESAPSTHYPGSPRMDAGRLPTGNRNLPAQQRSSHWGSSNGAVPIITSSQARNWNGGGTTLQLNDRVVPQQLPYSGPRVSQYPSSTNGGRGYNAPGYYSNGNLRR